MYAIIVCSMLSCHVSKIEICKYHCRVFNLIVSADLAFVFCYPVVLALRLYFVRQSYRFGHEMSDMRVICRVIFFGGACAVLFKNKKLESLPIKK